MQWVLFSPKIHITKVNHLCKSHLGSSGSSEVSAKVISEGFKFPRVSHLKIHYHVYTYAS